MKIYGKHTSQLKLVVGAPKAHPYKSHVVSNPHITIIINVFHKLSYKLYTWWSKIVIFVWILICRPDLYWYIFD